MSTQDQTPVKAKKFRRKLTPFLAKEMLYDYVTGRLDGERKAAIAEFIKTDKECQTIIDGIGRGLDCAERLSRTQIKPEVIAQLREAENAISLGRKYTSWREWPETLRWSIVALVVSSSLATTIMFVPWSKLPSFKMKKADSVELAHVQTSDTQQQVAAQEAPEGEGASTNEGSGDEMFDGNDLPPSMQGKGQQVAGAKAGVLAAVVEEEADHLEEDSPAQTSAAKLAASETAKRDLQANAKAPGAALVATALTDVAVKPTAIAKVAAGLDQAQTSVSDESGEQSLAREAKPKGFVLRAFMKLSNLDELAPKITEHIVEFGGERAGEVELGWRRGTGRYYHFALPEAAQEKMLEKLRAYGPVRISKDPHPRVMPQGQVRFILWVESAE